MNRKISLILIGIVVISIGVSGVSVGQENTPDTFSTGTEDFVKSVSYNEETNDLLYVVWSDGGGDLVAYSLDTNSVSWRKSLNNFGDVEYNPSTELIYATHNQGSASAVEMRVYDGEGNYQGGYGNANNDDISVDRTNGGVIGWSSGDHAGALINENPPFNEISVYPQYESLKAINTDRSLIASETEIYNYSSESVVRSHRGAGTQINRIGMNDDYITIAGGGEATLSEINTGDTLWTDSGSGFSSGVIHPDTNVVSYGKNNEIIYHRNSGGELLSQHDTNTNLYSINRAFIDGEYRILYAGQGEVGYVTPDIPAQLDGFVSGKDRLSSKPINDATIRIFNNSNDQISQLSTNNDGYYSTNIGSGEYRIEVNKTGWISDSKEINFTDDMGVNFTLRNATDAFEFRASNFMDHGTTQEYSAVFNPPDSSRLEGVTGNTTVTSDNSSIVSVDSTNNSLVATSNVSINNRTTITAEYVRDNQTYTSVQEITVANRTMENIEIMPPSQYIPAALGFGEEGTVFGIGSEIQWVLLSVFIGSAAAWIARNEWVGVGIIIGTHVFFWVLGNISLGITMVAVFYGLMAAYQLNKIPGRSDTNVGGNQDSPPPQPPQQ